MYDLLLLDLDNTLIDRRSTFARWADGYLQRHSAITRDCELAVARAELLAADGAGLVPRDHFCAQVAALFPPGSRPAVDEVWLEFAADYVAAVEPEPAVQAALLALAQQYELALLSNGSGARQRAKLRRAGLEGCFERIFISDELGWDKPEPALFRHALRISNITPDRALMVGDDPRRDVAGALAAGIDACWIARGREWATFGVPVTPTLIADDVPALAQHLASPVSALAAG